MCTLTALLCYSSRLAMWTGWRGTRIVSTLLLLFAFFLISFPFVFDGEALKWYLVRFTAKHKCSIDNLYERSEVVIWPRATCAYSCYWLNLRQGFFFICALFTTASVHPATSCVNSSITANIEPVTAHSGLAVETLLKLHILRNTFSMKSLQLACLYVHRVSSLGFC